MEDQKLFDELRHYGKIVADKEESRGDLHVRQTWYRYKKSLWIVIRRNGEIFKIQELKDVFTR